MLDRASYYLSLNRYLPLPKNNPLHPHESSRGVHLNILLPECNTETVDSESAENRKDRVGSTHERSQLNAAISWRKYLTLLIVSRLFEEVGLANMFNAAGKRLQRKNPSVVPVKTSSLSEIGFNPSVALKKLFAHISACWVLFELSWYTSFLLFISTWFEILKIYHYFITDAHNEKIISATEGSGVKFNIPSPDMQKDKISVAEERCGIPKVKRKIINVKLRNSCYTSNIYRLDFFLNKDLRINEL